MLDASLTEHILLFRLLLKPCSIIAGQELDLAVCIYQHLPHTLGIRTLFHSEFKKTLNYQACKLILFNAVDRVHHDYMSPESWSAVLSTGVSADNFSCTTIRKESTLINSTSTVCPIFLLRYLLWLEHLSKSMELSNEQNHHLRADDANFSSCTYVHTLATVKLHYF